MRKENETAAALLMQRMRKCLVALDRNLAAQVRGMEKLTKLTSELIRMAEQAGR